MPNNEQEELSVEQEFKAAVLAVTQDPKFSGMTVVCVYQRGVATGIFGNTNATICDVLGLLEMGRIRFQKWLEDAGYAS